MLDRTASLPLRVAVVTGSPETGRCGIHDYATTLGRSLRDQGVEVEIHDQRDWSTRGTLRLARALQESRPDVLQMQYPMIVGWRSLGPHALGFLGDVPQIVTLHEFSTFDWLRRASLRAFARSAAGIVMTSAAEAARFTARFPSARPRTRIIPIGSNVPFRPQPVDPGEARTIAYFGQIKPLKGLEQVLDLARIVVARGLPWRIRVIGAPVDWARGYLDGLRSATTELPVTWHLDRPDEEASALLAEASAAYLPFPDGASERRGSLIAALGNGVPVVTTDGPDRPEEMGDLALFAEGPSAACARLAGLFADPALEHRLRMAGPAYVRRFDWDVIAGRFVTLYQAAAARTELAR